MNLLNNRYRIIKELGAGGFGNTYLAEDTQMPSLRCCVIKQLKPATHSSEIHQLVQQRFAREAAVLEKLGENSPQIPKLYAYFADGGQFYLVQEWIEGTTLTQIVEGGALKESAVEEILVSLLSVLQFVHAQGIVHRDIKPDNIILRARDRQPVLIDFGAVRETIGTQINSQGQPTSSIVIGTPGFMPAEQAAGRPVYSSDLYSLGLTAIYLLTGKMPQQLVTDPVSGEIVWDKQGISPNLANVLDRATRSHPRERFLSARDMLDALTRAPVSYPTQPPDTLPPSQGSYPAASSTPTVRVAPPATQPPLVAPRENKLNPLVIGSLVGAGLIGGSLVLGLMLNRNSLITRESTSSQPLDSITPASSPDISQAPDRIADTPPVITQIPEETETPSPQVSPSPSSAPAVSAPVATQAPATPLETKTTSPQPIASVSPAPAAPVAPNLSPTSPLTATSAPLSRVYPTYLPNALSTVPRFARCLPGEILYQVGDMPNSRFAICGVDENPPQTPTAYIAYDTRTGETNRAEFRDNRFFKLDERSKKVYAYDPPSYTQTNYKKPAVGVYRDGRLIQNVRIIKLYKRE